jgi:hypothetical protein
MPRGSDGVVNCDSSRGEVAIPRGHDELGVIDRSRGCQVDGVVAPQTVAFRELAGSPRKGFVEADHIQFVTQILDRPHGCPQRACVDAAAPVRRRRGGARFRIDQSA